MAISTSPSPKTRKRRRFSLTRSFMPFALGLLDADGDNEVVRRNRADILESVQGVGRGISHTPRPQLFAPLAHQELHRAFADEHQLGMNMLVRRVRHLSGRQRSFMHLDGLSGRQYPVQNGA